MKKVAVGTIKALESVQPKIIKIGEIENESIEIVVKQYLPIKDKMILIQLIVNNCFVNDEETGIKKLNVELKNMLFEYFVTMQYTNINESKNIFDMYDMLKSAGVVDLVFANIPSKEICFLDMCLMERIDEELRIEKEKNNVVNVVRDFLGNLMDKIPNEEVIKNTLEEFKNLDQDKLKFVADAIKFNNGINQ